MARAALEVREGREELVDVDRLVHIADVNWLRPVFPNGYQDLLHVIGQSEYLRVVQALDPLNAPPIVVDGTRRVVLDGGTRVIAARMRGVKQLRAVVLEGLNCETPRSVDEAAECVARMVVYANTKGGTAQFRLYQYLAQNLHKTPLLKRRAQDVARKVAEMLNISPEAEEAAEKPSATSIRVSTAISVVIDVLAQELPEPARSMAQQRFYELITQNRPRVVRDVGPLARRAVTESCVGATLMRRVVNILKGRLPRAGVDQVVGVDTARLRASCTELVARVLNISHEAASQLLTEAWNAARGAMPPVVTAFAISLALHARGMPPTRAIEEAARIVGVSIVAVKNLWSEADRNDTLKKLLDKARTLVS